jgi:pyruvate, water dikinase
VSSFVALADADAGCGGKATALGVLMRAGFAVPDGVVLPAADPGWWQHDLPDVLAGLGGARFAVRSSGSGEDGLTASYAGQLHTSLDVRADEVADEIRRTATSTARARAYVDALGHDVGQISVIVQRMLAPVAAGVAFTRHPLTDEHAIVIEAVHGLGEPLVAGRSTPQRWQPGEGGTLTATGPAVLSRPQAQEVADLADRIEACLGGGQDVEWAITGDRRVWVLQARPISTTAPMRRVVLKPIGGAHLASGTPAGPGTAHGCLRVIGGPDDFGRFERGEVLVCRTTSPAWTPLLTRAAAVVTETGGVLAHAAIVARELGIPAVTDVLDATRRLDGAPAIVDGTAGTITAGEMS